MSSVWTPFLLILEYLLPSALPFVLLGSKQIITNPVFGCRADYARGNLLCPTQDPQN